MLEIVGSRRPSPRERALLEAPWELLWFDGRYLAADVSIGYTPLRRIGERKTVRGSRPGSLSVLFMAAAAAGEAELDFEDEEALILRETDGLGIDLFVEETGTAKELGLRAVRLGADPAHALHIVHLICHGTNVPEPLLLLEDETGDAARTSTAELLDALGERGRELGLLFVSACSTAASGGFTREQDSLALGLTRAGFPAVLGWAASVFDDSATRFAAALYERIGRGDATLERAVSQARRALLDRADPHWHLARLFLGSRGGGKLAEPAGPRRKGLPIHGGFLGDDRRSPVAGPEVFVGRRRLLQRCVRVLRKRERAGVLLQGFGQNGKSSLAARIVDRMSEHEAVVMYGRFDAINVIRAIKDKLGARVEGWYQRWSGVTDADLEPALRDLLDGHLSERSGNRPMLLVLDDFEQLLEDPPNHSRVRAPYRATVAAILQAFRHADTRSRLLVTSRFRFRIADKDGRELSDALELVPVGGFSIREAAKRTRREPPPPQGQTDLRPRCAAASRGNPALLALLLKRASADYDGCVQVLAQIEALEEHSFGVDDEEFLELLRRTAVSDLLRSLGEDEHELFARSLLFDSPLPFAALSVLEQAGSGCRGDAERLLALGVWEEGRDLADTGERSFAVNGLIRGIALRQEIEASAEVRREVAAGLVELISERWAMIGRDTEDPSKARAGFLVVELASQLGEWEAVRTFGRLALAWARRTMASLEVQGFAKRLIEQLEEAGVSPEPRLLGDVALIHRHSGEGKFYHRCLERALSFACTENKLLAAEDQAALHLQMARSHLRRGELAFAEAHLAQGREVLVGGAFDRQRAAFDGVRADILQVRGELDEALRIRREELLPVYARLGEVREWAVTMSKVADILQAKGELDEALRIRREEQLPIYERLGDVRSRAVTMSKVADILQVRGELGEALRIRCEEELPVYRRLGDVREQAMTLGKVADILRARGELDEALRILREEELPVYERLGDVRSRAATMGAVAYILRTKGELDEALRIHQIEQLPVFERLGDVRSRAVTMGKVADILQARGELGEAVRIRRQEELPVYERVGDVRELLVGRTNLALTLVQRGRKEDSSEVEELLALALRDARRLRLPEAQQIEQLIRHLGGDPDRPPFA
ncbi:MAG: CHAT domain-containing protein [Enhygromyxa sp.]